MLLVLVLERAVGHAVGALSFAVLLDGRHPSPKSDEHERHTGALFMSGETASYAGPTAGTREGKGREGKGRDVWIPIGHGWQEQQLE